MGFCPHAKHVCGCVIQNSNFCRFLLFCCHRREKVRAKFVTFIWWKTARWLSHHFSFACYLAYVKDWYQGNEHHTYHNLINYSYIYQSVSQKLKLSLFIAVSVGLIWDSESPDAEHIADVLQCIGTTLKLSDVRNSTLHNVFLSYWTFHLFAIVQNTHWMFG